MRKLTATQLRELEDIKAHLRVIDFRLIRKRTPAEYTELRRWLDAGSPDRWTVA